MLPAEVTNVRFVAASATDTGLARESFDLVYRRFLLIHLKEPEAALREMRDLLKPGGIIVCEDGDLKPTCFCQWRKQTVARVVSAGAGPSFVQAGLLSNEELTQTVIEMRRFNEDETVVALMPRMSQVWARKTGPSCPA